MLSRSSRWPGRARQAGLSIVELMVGVTIGLIVVAAASLLMSTQLVENRKLLTETQLQQDLRATADIMTRELRRAGALAEFPTAGTPAVIETVWSRSHDAQSNPHNDVTTSTGSIDFMYAPSDNPTTVLQSRFVLNTGVINTLMSVGPQALTDTGIMQVTNFAITLTPATATPIRIPCPKPCLDGTGDCWPTFHVREVAFSIEAEARRDARVKRAIRSRTRLRNDYVYFDPVNAGKICPI